MTTTIKRNNVGNLTTVVRPLDKSAPSFEGQKYKPTAYLFDEELNEWVSFYWMTAEEYYSNAGGTQCTWIHNNAQVNNESHFGIKLTAQNHGTGNAKSAALAMYQRQKLAAEHDLATPVHGLCCMKVFSKAENNVVTFWGYLSCRAQMDCIGENPEALAAFEEYVDEFHEKWKKIEEIEDMLDNTEWISGRTQNRVLDFIKEDMGCYEHPDDLSFYDWCNDNDYNPLDIGDLKDELFDLDASGLQHDFFPIGSKYPRGSYMGSDLHEGNVGMWGSNVVCIDFGYHCLNERNRCYAV
jgi:hypothetical protein